MLDPSQVLVNEDVKGSPWKRIDYLIEITVAPRTQGGASDRLSLLFLF